MEKIMKNERRLKPMRTYEIFTHDYNDDFSKKVELVEKFEADGVAGSDDGGHIFSFDTIRAASFSLKVARRGPS